MKFDVTTEDAFDIDNNPAVLIKISNIFIEINIYILRSEIKKFLNFIQKNEQRIQSGISAQSVVYWIREEKNVYILIGDDDQTWDISLTADENLLNEIYNEIIKL